MKSFPFLLLFICATQLATSTEFNDDYIFKEKMQKFTKWFPEHDKQFPKHSCLNSRHEECKYGVFLMTNIVGKNFNQSDRLNVWDLSFSKIQADHRKSLEKSMSNRVELSPEMKKLSQESTNAGTNTDDEYENGYFDNDENYSDEIESNLADWILEKMYGFKEKNFVESRIIRECKIKFEKSQKASKFYKESRSGRKITENIEEYKIELTDHQKRKAKLYKMSGNALKMNRLFMEEKSIVGVKCHVLKKKRAQTKKKNKMYKRAKNGFGNQLEVKLILPFLSRIYSTKVIEQNIEYIDKILCDVDTLKPVEMKKYFKEFSEEISSKWKKAQLVRKLSGLLNKKRQALQQNLEMAANVTEYLVEYPMKNDYDDARMSKIKEKKQKCLSEILKIQEAFSGDLAEHRSHEENYQFYKQAKLLRKQVKINFFEEAQKDMELKQNQMSEILKLKKVLNEMPDSSLEKKLENSIFWKPEYNIMKDDKRSKMKVTGRPILMPNLGDNVYLTEDGFIVHAPRSGEKTLFKIEENTSQFAFKDKIYSSSSICGNKIYYTSENSSGLEVKFIFSYEERERVNIPIVGDVLEVGGMPTISAHVKIMNKWERRKYVSAEDLMKRLHWWREDKKKMYQNWKTMPKFQNFY